MTPTYRSGPPQPVGAAGLRSPLLAGAAALALLCALVATLHTFVTRSGFNEDEFFQLAFVNQPLPSFFALFVRLDQHPFFHFLQLKLWALPSQADGWMLGNSLLWQALSALAIGWVGRQWLGAGAGLLAAALYLLLPQVVVAGTTLRFYAMMPALAVLSWWLHQRVLQPADALGNRAAVPAGRWWALAGVQLALAYSHAIAFFFVFWLALAGALQAQGAARGQPLPWRRWLLVQAAVALAVLPQVLLTAGRALMTAGGGGGGDSGNADPGGLVDHFGGMVAGWGMQWPLARALGAALFVLALGLGLWQARTRRTVAVMLLGPYAAAWLIGLVLTPMYKTPVYSAVLMPFMSLALAGGLLALARPWREAATLALLLALVLAVFPASRHLNRYDSPYRPAAEALRQLAKPGDVVVVAKPYLYWGLLRYAVAPDWGAPLDVLPAPNASWRKLGDKLGPQASAALHFLPRSQQLQSAGVTWVVGEDARAASATARRVWLVERGRAGGAVQLDPAYSANREVFRTPGADVITLRLYER